MIKPTIGRVMWYWPAMGIRDDQPWAALVTKVWDDNMVNLVVFDHEGMGKPKASVPIIQDGSPHTDTGSPYVEWMPYQIGQAKKHAEEETKA